MSGTATVHRARLIKPLERTIAAGHPWIWRDALEVHGARVGDVLAIEGKRGQRLALAIADEGPIGARVWTTGRQELDADLFVHRVRAAASLRERIMPAETDAFRLLHGEGDRTPGFVCDVYGKFAVMRIDGAGAEVWSDTMIEALRPTLDAFGVRSLLVRRGRRENMKTDVAWGSAPAGPITVHEHGMRLVADLLHGQKTGLFLDHRESRRRVRDWSVGLRVLNLYGYTGGFSVAAGLGGAASVVTVDVAKPAIEMARATWRANDLPEKRHTAVAADAIEFLDDSASREETFDLIVADPPSFAPRADTVRAALASYQALHQRCLKLLTPGGLYIAASCSSHVDAAAFGQTLTDAASREGKILQILERSGAPADHPRLTAFPEGDYLKVLVARLSQ